ncbi:MAG TPA: SRPBCC family protein [Candidatus Saccharimonadales bacterium]|jgi:hypothetical protein
MKQRSYDFKSTWLVSVPAEAVEAVLLNLETWTSWWPGLESASVVKPVDEVVGSIITCTWRSPAGYRLHMRMMITEYVPGRYIRFKSVGDLEGQGSWSFISPDGASTRMDIIWQVSTTRPWMNASGPILRPLFVYSHNLLMRRGNKGLQAYLLQQDLEP